MTPTSQSDGILTLAAPPTHPEVGSPTPAVADRQGGLLARVLPYVSIARPDHWFKNVFMVAGVMLALFCHPETLGWDRLVPFLCAVAATCLLASSNYVINEILDAPSDRSHPKKRLRPIPSGACGCRSPTPSGSCSAPPVCCWPRR